MALHTETPIYKAAYDLLDVVTDLAKNMPRDFKASIGGKLRDECIAVTVLVFRANVAKDKLRHLDSLVERQQVLELLLRLSRDKRLISTAQYARAVQLTGSIGKGIVAGQLARRIHEPWWRQLAETILFHDPREGAILRSPAAMLATIPPHKSLFNQDEHHGLPIGNLSSQFFANVFLDDLDQHCKHDLKARHYIRYVDDFVLLHPDPQWLRTAHADIEAWLPQRLGARLNAAKTILQPVARGVDFAGQVIKPCRRTLRRRTYREALSRCRDIDGTELFETANSYFGLLRQASHSHTDRAALANLLRYRGHTIDQHFTKTFRRTS